MTPPIRYAEATKSCGKCSAKVPVKGCGGKVHRVYRWVCADCAASMPSMAASAQSGGGSGMPRKEGASV